MGLSTLECELQRTGTVFGSPAPYKGTSSKKGLILLIGVG